MHPDSRVAELEARISTSSRRVACRCAVTDEYPRVHAEMLEHEILMRDDPPRAARGSSAHTRTSSTSMFSSPMPPVNPALRASPSAPHRPSPLRTNSSESDPRATPPTLLLLTSAPPREDFSRTAYGVFVSAFWRALTEPGDPTGTRRRHGDAVVAGVHERAGRLSAARRARHALGTSQEDYQPVDARSGLGLSEAACPPRPGQRVSAKTSSEEDLFEEMARTDATRVSELVDLDIEELAQNRDWARMAIWAVLDGKSAVRRASGTTAVAHTVDHNSSLGYLLLECPDDSAVPCAGATSSHVHADR